MTTTGAQNKTREERVDARAKKREAAEKQAKEVTEKRVKEIAEKQVKELAEKQVKEIAEKRAKEIKDKAPQSQNNTEQGKKLTEKEKQQEAKKKDALRKAKEEAGDIGQLFYQRAMSTAQNMKAQSDEEKQKRALRLQEIQASEAALKNQGTAYISLDSAGVKLKISAFKTQFDFAPAKKGDSYTYSASDITDFCDLLKDYQASCEDRKAEDLEYTLIGSDKEALRAIAKRIESNTGIELNKIQYDGPGPFVLTNREAILGFLRGPDIELRAEAKAANRL